MLSATFDIGGQGVRFAEAFAKHGDGWTVRSMSQESSFLAYPVDLPWRKAQLPELYQWADIIHARNDFSVYDPLAAKFGPKPVVIHYHGSKFRGNPHYYIREQRKRNAIGLVSTLDLYLLAPDDLEWLPAPYDVDALRAMR
jgi:hypothetical protein